MSPSPTSLKRACWKTTRRSACRRTIPSSPALRTALRALMPYPAARSILRALLIPAASRSQQDGKSAYALLNQNDTLAQIDLTTATQGEQIRVGNAPHSVVIDSKGTTAYVSNEGGRAATETDFQIWSAGTEIVADSVVGAAITGTVSVVDLPSMKVTANISTGLHPTGMAFYGQYLLVANTYSDTISVIDTATNVVTRTINLALPIGVPGQGPAYGAASELDCRRCQEWRCLRRAVQCQRDRGGQPRQGRDESRHGHDPGSLCAKLGRAEQEPITRSSLPMTRASAPVFRTNATTASATTIPTRTMAPSASSPYRFPGPCRR